MISHSKFFCVIIASSIFGACSSSNDAPPQDVNVTIERDNCGGGEPGEVKEKIIVVPGPSPEPQVVTVEVPAECPAPPEPVEPAPRCSVQEERSGETETDSCYLCILDAENNHDDCSQLSSECGADPECFAFSQCVYEGYFDSKNQFQWEYDPAPLCALGLAKGAAKYEKLAACICSKCAQKCCYTCSSPYLARTPWNI